MNRERLALNKKYVVRLKNTLDTQLLLSNTLFSRNYAPHVCEAHNFIVGCCWTVKLLTSIRSPTIVSAADDHEPLPNSVHVPQVSRAALPDNSKLSSCPGNVRPSDHTAAMSGRLPAFVTKVTSHSHTENDAIVSLVPERSAEIV